MSPSSIDSSVRQYSHSISDSTTFTFTLAITGMSNRGQFCLPIWCFPLQYLHLFVSLRCKLCTRVSFSCLSFSNFSRLSILSHLLYTLLLFCEILYHTSFDLSRDLQFPLLPRFYYILSTIHLLYRHQGIVTDHKNIEKNIEKACLFYFVTLFL